MWQRSKGAGVMRLAVSHALAFAIPLSVTSKVAYYRQIRAATENPLSRVGERLAQFDEMQSRPDSFEQDVAASGKNLRPPATQVFRLMGHLRGVESRSNPDYSRASDVCKALGWPDCGLDALAAMRKVLR
jgi:hypothetical protein